MFLEANNFLNEQPVSCVLKAGYCDWFLWTSINWCSETRAGKLSEFWSKDINIFIRTRTQKLAKHEYAGKGIWQ